VPTLLYGLLSSTTPFKKSISQVALPLLSRPNQSASRHALLASSPQKSWRALKGRPSVNAVLETPSLSRLLSRMTEQKPVRPVLAIVDEFCRQDAPLMTKTLASGKQQDFYTTHGSLVEAHARMVVPDLRVRRYQTQPIGIGRSHDLNPALAELLKDLESGMPIHAVNVSTCISVPFSRLREGLQLPELSGENVMSFREHILEHLNRIRLFEESQDLKNSMAACGFKPGPVIKASIGLLDRIAEKVPVCIASGNTGPENFNLLLLARNATGVGASAGKYKQCLYSGKNERVKEWADVTTKTAPVLSDHQDEMKGFTLQPLGDFTPFYREQDRQALVPMSQVRNLQAGQERIWEDRLWGCHILQGTSYAAPQVAARKAQQKALDLPQEPTL
jgi:hypothetical protein